MSTEAKAPVDLVERLALILLRGFCGHDIEALDCHGNDERPRDTARTVLAELAGMGAEAFTTHDIDVTQWVLDAPREAWLPGVVRDHMLACVAPVIAAKDAELERMRDEIFEASQREDTLTKERNELRGLYRMAAKALDAATKEAESLRARLNQVEHTAIEMLSSGYCANHITHASTQSFAEFREDTARLGCLPCQAEAAEALRAKVAELEHLRAENERLREAIADLTPNTPSTR
jgi:hypothetical protein